MNSTKVRFRLAPHGITSEIFPSPQILATVEVWFGFHVEFRDQWSLVIIVGMGVPKKRDTYSTNDW